MSAEDIDINVRITNEVKGLIKSYEPKFKIIPKRKSWFHRLIGKVFKAYMKTFWTTIGFTAAHPTLERYDWRTISHEGVHVLQAKKWTRVLFGFLYLSPQSLLPLVVLLAVFVNPVFLFGLLCLLPLPALFRAHAELQAYKLTVMIHEWSYGPGATDRLLDHITRQFTSMNYYVMFPFPGVVKSSLREAKEIAKLWVECPVEARQRVPYPQYTSEIFKIIKDNNLFRRKYKEILNG